MDKRKFKTKRWHHRVPDFELVYCGPAKPGKPETNRPRIVEQKQHTPKRQKKPNPT